MILSERNTVPAVIIACSLVLAAHIVLFWGFTVDDAFISFRYAENFAAGRGLVFNQGERVEGYSNFLWVLVLGLVRGAGIDVVVASKILGLLSLAAILILVYRLVRAFTGGSIYACGSLVLAATSFGLLFFAVTGMETIFYAALLTGAGYLFFRSGSRVTAGLAVIAAAAALTRPEGVLLFPCLAAFELYRSRRLSGRLIIAAVVFAPLIALFLVWRHRYYGYLLPNTYYAKPPATSASLPPVISGFDDIHRCFTFNGGPLLLVASLLLLLRRSTREKIYPLLPVAVAVIVFQLYSGGDWMGSYRFLVPLLPLYFAIGAYAIWYALGRLATRRRSALFLAVVVLLGLFNIGETAVFYLKRDEYPQFVMTSEDLVPAARWVGERYPAEYTIVCWRIGALAYYSGMNLVDISWGLTDEFVAHSRYRGEWNEEARNAYLHERNPELYMTSAVRGASLGEEIEAGGRRYRLVRDFRQGARELWVLYERGDLPGRPP